MVDQTNAAWAVSDHNALALFTDESHRDPRHVFLTASEVIARYRWGRTKGYEQLREHDFPKPLAGRYRLDLLMAWEDEQLTAASAPTMSPAGPPVKRHSARKTSA